MILDNSNIQPILDHVNARHNHKGIGLKMEEVAELYTQEEGRVYIIEALDLKTTKYAKIGFRECDVKTYGIGYINNRIDNMIIKLDEYRSKKDVNI